MACAAHISPADVGVQAVARIVGIPDRVFVIVIGDDAEDGAENLVAGDRHVVLHIDEYCRLHEVARFETFRTALAADQDLGALFNAFADVGLHALILLLRRHRSDSDLRIGRITCRKSANRFLDSLLDRV